MSPPVFGHWNLSAHAVPDKATTATLASRTADLKPPDISRLPNPVRMMLVRRSRRQSSGAHSSGKSLESAVAPENGGNICRSQYRKNFNTEEERRTSRATE